MFYSLFLLTLAQAHSRTNKHTLQCVLCSLEKSCSSGSSWNFDLLPTAPSTWSSRSLAPATSLLGDSAVCGDVQSSWSASLDVSYWGLQLSAGREH